MALAERRVAKMRLTSRASDNGHGVHLELIVTLRKEKDVNRKRSEMFEC